jgi:hypothetical protein
MWYKERLFESNNAIIYGKCVNKCHLSSFFIDGENYLIWGLKTYVHRECLVIASPLTGFQITVPYKSIQFPHVSNQTISFSFSRSDNQAERFELWTSSLDNKINSEVYKLVY